MQECVGKAGEEVFSKLKISVVCKNLDLERGQCFRNESQVGELTQWGIVTKKGPGKQEMAKFCSGLEAMLKSEHWYFSKGREST